MLPNQLFILIEIFNPIDNRLISSRDAGLILLEGRNGPTVAPKESGVPAPGPVGRSVATRPRKLLHIFGRIGN